MVGGKDSTEALAIREAMKILTKSFWSNLILKLFQLSSNAIERDCVGERW